MLLFEKCKKRLAILWFVFGGGLFVLMLIQSFGPKLGADANEVWSWLLAAIVPTLSLMIGVFAAGFGRKEENRQVEPFLFRLTYALSLFYLLVITAIFLVEPQTEKTLLQLTKQSSIYMTAFQGLVAALLAVFFVKK